eukprot:SAG11_NODE_19502_length_465_cov_1.131148_1_plen_78_part_01
MNAAARSPCDFNIVVPLAPKFRTRVQTVRQDCTRATSSSSQLLNSNRKNVYKLTRGAKVRGAPLALRPVQLRSPSSAT